MGSRSGSHRAEKVVNPAIGCDSSRLTPPTDIENDISQPNLSRKDLIAREELKRLRTLRNRPNVFKIPLFIGIMMGLTWAAWTTDSSLIRWSSYVALGYMWMGIVTFMHEGTHNTLFEREWANWAFGIVAMIPLMVCFVAFKEERRRFKEPWPHMNYAEIGDSEVARIPLHQSSSSEAVDLLTFSFEQKGKMAVLKVAWGEQLWTADMAPGKMEGSH